eukprot:14294411-Alexandrium_andersonii.AAC.1
MALFSDVRVSAVAGCCYPGWSPGWCKQAAEVQRVLDAKLSACSVEGGPCLLYTSPSPRD